MCGRTKVAVAMEDLHHLVALELGIALATGSGAAVFPNDNVSPTDLSPVLVRTHSGEVLFTQARWGVAAPGGESRPVFNARADKLNGAFWRPKVQHRCVAVVTGWYEWPIIDGKKVKHLFSDAAGGLIYFPAVYELGEPTSYATITIDAGPAVAPYHDREPVTFTRDEALRWLHPGLTYPQMMAMLRPAPVERLKVESAAPPARTEETAVRRKPDAPPAPPPAQGSLFGDAPAKRRRS